jgi:hypothetical protein
MTEDTEPPLADFPCFDEKDWWDAAFLTVLILSAGGEIKDIEV